MEKTRIGTPLRAALAALAASVVLTACAPRVDLEAERAALLARSDAVVAAEAAKDVDAALAFYLPDAVIQPANAPTVSGTAAIRGLYESFMKDPNFKSMSSARSGLMLAASGDMAYEHGVNRMVFATPSGEMTDVGKYLVVWKKVDGTWSAAMLAFSSDAPPAPMPAADAKTPMKK